MSKVLRDDRGISFDFDGYHSILFTDCDGVLTDGTVSYNEFGNRSRAFNVRDGHAFQMAKEAGLFPIILSGENDGSIHHRARKLDVPYFHTKDKLATAAMISGQLGIYCNIHFMGDDIMDMKLLKSIDFIGHSGCPNDAHPDIISLIKYASNGFIARKNGGDGAFREFVEYILSK